DCRAAMQGAAMSCSPHRGARIWKILGVVLALSAPLVNAMPPPVTPPPDHPRLLLRPADLPRVRGAMDDPALAGAWAELHRRAYLPDDYKPEPRYDLAVQRAGEATAFLGLVQADHATKRRAIG